MPNKCLQAQITSINIASEKSLRFIFIFLVQFSNKMYIALDATWNYKFHFKLDILVCVPCQIDRFRLSTRQILRTKHENTRASAHHVFRSKTAFSFRLTARFILILLIYTYAYDWCNADRSYKIKSIHWTSIWKSESACLFRRLLCEVIQENEDYGKANEEKKITLK